MQIGLHKNFDIKSVVADLDTIGGTSFALLPEGTRQYLTSHALRYEYRKREMIVGPANVRQDLSGVDIFSPDSPFCILRDAWEDLLNQKLGELPGGDSVFDVPIHFNDLSLQRYEVGSLGISPHLDSKTSINLICVFTLVGHCRFCICEDRDRTNPVELNAAPGNVILLRAPGFCQSDKRPFHFVTDIEGPRISFGLRQQTGT